jgi:hypothetical protein
LHWIAAETKGHVSEMQNLVMVRGAAERNRVLCRTSL